LLDSRTKNKEGIGQIFFNKTNKEGFPLTKKTYMIKYTAYAATIRSALHNSYIYYKK